MDDSIRETPPSPAPAKTPKPRELFAPSRFLHALIVLLVASPFLDSIAYGKMIEAVLMTAVFVSALLVVADRRHVVAALVIAMVPLVVGIWLHGMTVRLTHPSFRAVSGLFFVGFAIVKLLGRVLRAREVDAEVLSAAIATYLCLGLWWSFGYTLIAQIVPGSFTFSPGSGSLETMRGFETLYFSFCTLTTVGYGDIVPVAKVARMLVMTEATCGVFYMTILIARLVSLYSVKPAKE